jgi:hypothetical protein
MPELTGVFNIRKKRSRFAEGKRTAGPVVPGRYANLIQYYCIIQQKRVFKLVSKTLDIAKEIGYTYFIESNRNKKMLKNGLYHKDVFLPKISLSDKMVKVNYTHHAIDAAYNDRYEEIILPNALNFAKSEIIEVEIKNKKIVKIVARFDYNNNYDLVIVIIPQGKIIKTVWLNDKNDTHLTLDTSKYNKNEF